MEDGADTGRGPFFPFGLLFWGALGDLGDLDLGFLFLGLFGGLENSCRDSKLVGVKDRDTEKNLMAPQRTWDSLRPCSWADFCFI